MTLVAERPNDKYGCTIFIRDDLKEKSISVTAANHVKVSTAELPDVVVHSVYNYISHPASSLYSLTEPSPDCNRRFQQPQHHMVPTTPACTWWNRPEEDPSSGKLESTHPSRTSVKYDQVFFLSSQSLDIRDATTSTPGTLNDLPTDLIMANNNNNTPQITTV